MFLQIEDDHSAAKHSMTIPGDWRRPGLSMHYRIVWRAKDGFGQITPRPDPAEVANYYDLDTYYTHGTMQKDYKRRKGGLFRILQHLAWRMDRSVEPDENWWNSILHPGLRRCLDVGCGSGQLLSELKARGLSVVGIEPDAAARTLALEAKIEVHDGTAELIPTAIADREFDCISMIHSLEHCIDPVSAVKNIRGVLSSDGVLIVEVPNNECLGLRFFGTTWHWLDVPRHLNFFTAASLTDMLNSAGYEIDRLEFRGFNRQFSADWASVQFVISDRLGSTKGRQLWRYVALLCASSVSSPRYKYDSVRVVARKQSTDPTMSFTNSAEVDPTKGSQSGSGTSPSGQ